MRLSILIFICAICTTTVSSGFDCDNLCQGVPDNEYVSDGCCNSKYCMCYGNAGYEEECKTPDTLFCQSSGVCVENCQSTSGCCDQNPTTTTQQTTTPIKTTSTISTSTTTTSTSTTSTFTTSTSASTSTSTTSTSTTTVS